MFGLRALRRTEDDRPMALDAPCSRFDAARPPVTRQSKYSRFRSLDSDPHCAPQMPPAPVAATVDTAPPRRGADADLHSDAPIPVALLRRALPLRFAAMQAALIQKHPPFAASDEIEFVFR